jgi:hypothetical protein
VHFGFNGRYIARFAKGQRAPMRVHDAVQSCRTDEGANVNTPDNVNNAPADTHARSNTVYSAILPALERAGGWIAPPSVHMPDAWCIAWAVHHHELKCSALTQCNAY